MKRNKNSFLEVLTRNWGLKVASFIFAVALWLVVVNVNDPTIRYSWSNIPVTIENGDMITSQGMIYEVLDGTDVVSKVTIQAPKSVIQNIDKSDIIATADMSKLNSVNTISIDFSVSRYSSQISSIRGSIDSVKVNIENMKSKSMVLQTSVEGEAPDGYMVGNVSTDQNLIRISGPESLVDQIESAGIKVDMSTLSGFTSDITASSQVHLYNGDGDEITGRNLEKRPENVLITIEILSKKTVPITFTTDTVPAEGYGLTGEITSSLNYVEIAGRKSVLNNIGEIQIPAEVLDVTGATEDFETYVNIKDYLPENTRVADSSFDGKAHVVVGIERETTEEYELDGEKIRITNVPEGYRCEIENAPETYTVSITGIHSVVSGLNARNLEATVDVAGWVQQQEMTELAPGIYNVELTINNPEHTRLTNPVYMNLVVVEEE
ncbi:MAG: YbbR-like domain-containing protein [Lachnospiraceae bacterium]